MAFFNSVMQNITSAFSWLNVSANSELTDSSNIVQSSSQIQQELITYWQTFLQVLPSAMVGFILALGLFLVARPLSKQLIKPIGYLSSSVLIQRVTRRVISLLIILFGLYLFLKFAGLGDFAVAVLSGTGLMGLIIGFAFKDIAENFISSLLLSIQKPFQLDDVIEVQGHLGVVKQVTARATTLVDFDGNHIQLPNSTVYKNVIRNLTANPKTRGSFMVGIGYDSSIIESQKIAMDVMLATEAVLEDPEPQVLVEELASSTINLKIYFWIDTHQHSLLKVSSLLMRSILRELEHAGISMPDDKREVIFPQGLPGVKLDEAQPTSEQCHPKPHEGPPNSQQDQNINDQNVDLSSDTQDIREQARLARDPEQGDNIL